MKSKKSAKGLSLLETLITIVIVGILSVACGTMLIFAYSMFEKVMGKGSASLEYKTFRFTTEKVFRNMTKEGPLIYNMITDDELDQYSKKDDVSDAICMAFMSWIEEHCKSRNKKQHGYVNKQESNIDATSFIRRYISSMQIYNTLFAKRYGNSSK